MSQIVLDHGVEGLRDFWLAVPRGSNAAEVRGAYESLFGRPIDVLIDPYAVELPGGGSGEVDRSMCSLALCPAEPTVWDGGRWAASGPVGCEDDPLAIGPDRQALVHEYGEVWRDYEVQIEAGLFDRVASPSVGANIVPCSFVCSSLVGIGAVQQGTSIDGAYWDVGGPWRVEVRSAVDDLPTETPGAFTIEAAPP